MKPITKIDKTTAPVLRKAIDAALKAIAEQYGLESIELGNIRMDREGTYFKSEVECKVKQELSPALQQTNLLYSEALGYNKNIVGETFTRRDGRTFKVTAIDLKKPKFPIIAVETGSGAGFKFENSHRLNFEDATITRTAQNTVNF